MQFKREWKSEYVQTHLSDATLFDRGYHVHIFGDFLIEASIAEELAKDIDGFYASNSTLTLECVSEFEKLVTKKLPVRMKISRKPNKAARLRKQLSKPFYLPTTMRTG